MGKGQNFYFLIILLLAVILLTQTKDKESVPEEVISNQDLEESEYDELVTDTDEIDEILEENIDEIIIEEPQEEEDIPIIEEEENILPKEEEIPGDQQSIILSGTLNGNYVELIWTPKSENFKNYKIIRSTTNPIPSYPKDKYLKTILSPDITSYVDKKPKEDLINYYTIALILQDRSVEYSNIISFDFRNPQKEIISLRANIINDSVHLNWEFADQNIKYYKLVRSATNKYPIYPNDNFISTISDPTITSFIDNKPLVGENHYGVTIVYKDNSKKYSNPVSISIN